MGWNIELTLVPNLQIRLRKSENLWHLSGRGKKLRWESKQNAWLSRSSRLRGCYRKDVLKNFLKIAGASFLIKLDAVDLQLHFKRDPSITRISTFFAEHHQTTVFEYSSINRSARGISTRNCRLLYRNQNTPIWARSVSYQKGAVQVKEKV